MVLFLSREKKENKMRERGERDERVKFGGFDLRPFVQEDAEEFARLNRGDRLRFGQRFVAVALDSLNPEEILISLQEGLKEEGM